MKNIFAEEESKILERILFCTGLQLTKGDWLPDNICDKCSEDLTTAYNFKTTCLTSDECYQNIASKIKTEKLDVKYENIDDDEVFDDGDFGNDDFEDGDFEHEEKDKNEILKEDDFEDGDFELEEKDKKEILEELLIEANVPKENWDSMIQKLSQRKTQSNSKRKRKAGTKAKKAGTKSKKASTKTKKASTKASNKLTENVEKDVKCKPIYTCDACNIDYTTKEKFWAHKKAVHNEIELLVCDVCGKSINYNSFQSHLVSHYPPEFACDACDYTAVRKSDLRKHQRIHEGACEVHFTSSGADKVSELRTWSRTTRRSLRATRATTPPCASPTCASTREYMKRSHYPPEFACDACDYTAVRKSDLRKHQRIHEGVNPFRCPHCAHPFRTSSALHFHVRTVHEHAPKRFECTVCEKRFYTSTRLKRHMDSHDVGRVADFELLALRLLHEHAPKRFKCTVCEKRFYTSTRLKRHMDSHDVGRIDVADFELLALRLLHEHAPKRFKCTVCEKRFYTSTRLKRHMDSHDVGRLLHEHAPKRFKCTVCEKRFYTSTRLKRHMDSHDVGRLLQPLHAGVAGLGLLALRLLQPLYASVAGLELLALRLLHLLYASVAGLELLALRLLHPLYDSVAGLELLALDCCNHYMLA
ncbi:zinc-finger associated domain (zf-AD) domain-containing protein [Phthorimaea operculella]|nr:zinc-finger associated domain (zf-AD) domain-containing protein [Phthorimaea operculella]